MTAKLQTLIQSAQQLTPAEQVELIHAVSRLLYKHYQQELPAVDFWQTQPIEQIVASQQTSPVSDISALKVDFWPDDETVDDFIQFVQQQHHEDRLDS